MTTPPQTSQSIGRSSEEKHEDKKPNIQNLSLMEVTTQMNDKIPNR